MNNIIQTHLDQFFDLLKKKYNIDAKNEWFNQYNNDFCTYTFKIGPKKGTMCAKKAKGEYCSAHKPKELKKLQKEIEPKVVSNIAKFNKKIGKYIHEQTRLAFFSKEKQVVYGKVSIYDDRIIPLCDKDIEQCKKYQFQYDESLYKHGL